MKWASPAMTIPDDRRTYPWADKGGTPDQSMFTHYQTLNTLRKANAVLTAWRFQDPAGG